MDTSQKYPFKCTVSVDVSINSVSRSRVSYEESFKAYADLFRSLDYVAEQVGFEIIGGGQDFNSYGCECVYGGPESSYIELKQKLSNECTRLRSKRIIRSFCINKGVGIFSDVGVFPLDDE